MADVRATERRGAATVLRGGVVALAATGLTLVATGCGGAPVPTTAKVTPLTAGLPAVTPNQVSRPPVAQHTSYTAFPTTGPPGSSGTSTLSPVTYPNWCYPSGSFNRYYANGLGVPALTVLPGVGTAAVSWWSTGDPAITAYKIAAVPTWVVRGTQAALQWTSVPPTLTCQPVQIQLTGLQRSRTYEIWLDVVLRTGQQSVGRDIMANRSAIFTVR